MDQNSTHWSFMSKYCLRALTFRESGERLTAIYERRVQLHILHNGGNEVSKNCMDENVLGIRGKVTDPWKNKNWNVNRYEIEVWLDRKMT